MQGTETKLITKQQQKEPRIHKETILLIRGFLLLLFNNVLRCAFKYQCDFLSICLILLLCFLFVTALPLHSTPIECLIFMAKIISDEPYFCKIPFYRSLPSPSEQPHHLYSELQFAFL